MPRSTATTEPLTLRWRDAYRARVDLQDEVLALFERIEMSIGPLRDEAIVELVDRLRSIDRAVFFRRGSLPDSGSTGCFRPPGHAPPGYG